MRKCTECTETEDIKACSQCGILLCWEHRREFPPDFDDPWCPSCVGKHNIALRTQWREMHDRGEALNPQQLHWVEVVDR